MKDSFFNTIRQMFISIGKGMRITTANTKAAGKSKTPIGISNPNYFKQGKGPITIQYPEQKIPVPHNGRYRLYMETDDCIGCDKCARICPVDCITIETFRADGDLGKTSDGTIKRLHVPVFDIDMAKCMFCGLCTTVCPTECLFMTPVYDYSEYDRDNFNYQFGAYSPEEEKRVREETLISLAKKKNEKEERSSEQNLPNEKSTTPKPIFRKPIFKSKEVNPQEEKGGENLSQ